ncbi:MAG: hypothetical protein H7330_09095 [Hymenobacteraceae bacterium]|nr:hypothetical protein [Hymenobacteraceae bacterium]
MIIIFRLCGDVFADPRISADNLKEGMRDNLERLLANPLGGKLTAIATENQSLFQQWFGELVGKAAAATDQYAATDDQEAAREELLDFVREGYGHARFALRAPADKGGFTKLYPDGLDEYNNADLTNFDTLMTRYDQQLDEVKDQVGAAYVTEFDGLLAAYGATRGLQLQAKGKLSTARATVAATRPLITAQLTKTLHTICLHTGVDAALAASYWDQRFFDTESPEADKDDTAPAPTPGG